MSDIFVSYSSKDRAQALQLTELLASAGLSVWIDKQGIDLATSWSEEIVHAIDGCKAFVVMLSPSSVASYNVVKEVSLASEKKKKILPLDLEPVEIPPSMQYALAGIQRSPMTNIDAIIRTLEKLGLEATQAPTMKLVKETDGRKSLMILPFEDLSPTGDNGWFADGIVSELITVLSNIRSLRVADQQMTKEFKMFTGHLPRFAKEMSIRYFVQGDVRKFGDAIKISVRLLDIEAGDHLWQDTMKGMMQDIFAIQESVAQKVASGLQLHLSQDERQKLTTHGTANVEAYELSLKARDYFARGTKTDTEYALSLACEAVRLDPAFADAHLHIAIFCQELYRTWGKNPLYLRQGQDALENVRALEGETSQYCRGMSAMMRTLGDGEQALSYAQHAVALNPEFSDGYQALGFAYDMLDMYEDASRAYEKVVQLDNSIYARAQYVNSLHYLGDTQRLREAARHALPLFERHIRLNPDNTNIHVELALLYLDAGDEAEALRTADAISQLSHVDSVGLYNLACLYIEIGQYDKGLHHLQRAVNEGYTALDQLMSDPDLAPIRDRPEFQSLVYDLETKFATKKHG